MKRLLVLLLISLLLIACGNGEETSDGRPIEDTDTETQANSNEENEEQEKQEEVELTREDELTAFITEKVESDYNKTTIRDIKINEDMGSGEGYIVLVDLTFEAKNKPGMAKEMINMYSSDLAAILGQEHDDINQVVVFWEVPFLQESGNIAKIATERTDDGMAFTEQWYDPNIFD